MTKKLSENKFLSEQFSNLALYQFYQFSLYPYIYILHVIYLEMCKYFKKKIIIIKEMSKQKL